jgi:DNA-binding CsgD family transcriptional regulator/tetratricopeptide (TPR) repeat protein
LSAGVGPLMIGGVTRRVSSPVFVGRAAELERLTDALERASAGQPSLVLVAGEAGVGKSRLMSEFSPVVEAAGGVTITGGCLDLGEGGPPYAPFVEALRALARRLDAADREATFGPSADALGRLNPDLPRQAVGARDGDPPEASDRLGRLFDAVLAVLDRVSQKQPLVLVLEDIHWADGSTRNLVRFLVRNMRRERLLLLATYRSDDLHRRHPVLPLLGELNRAEGVERLELRRFGREELEQQLVGILGEAPAPARIDALLERSDGLPFFVEELVADAGRGQSQLPATLQDILGLRLATLSPPSLALVCAAAVVGGRVPHDRLAAASGMDEDALLAALREVIDARILVPVEGTDEPAYTFRHALLREAAHDELLPAERVRVHERLADHLGGLLRAGDATDPSIVADFALHAFHAHDLPRALEGSIRALLTFVDAVAYREALAQAERALELWPRVDDAGSRAGIDHPGLLALAGRMASAVNQAERAMAFTQQALAELDALEALEDRDRKVALLADLQWSAWASRDFRLSVEAAERAHALGSSSRPTRLKASVTRMLGVARWWEGRLVVSAGLLEEAMAIAELVDDQAMWADAAGALAHTRSDLGQGVRATALIDRSAEAVPEGDRRFDRVSSEIDRSVSALTCGRFAAAEQFGRLALDLASRYGWDEQLGPHCRATIVDALFELGRYEETEPIAGPILAGAGIHHSIVWMETTMARVAVARGRFDEAHRLIDGIDPSRSAWGEDSFAIVAVVDLARAEGRFAFVATAVDASIDGIEEREAVAPSFGLLGLGVGACADRAVLARRRRRPAEVEDAATHAHRWLGALRAIVDRARPEGGAGPWPEAILATAEAEMRRLEKSPDPDAWADVAQRWVGLSHPFQTAYARLRLAEALLERNGERVVADAALRQAHEVAVRIGATVLRAEVEALAGAARLDLGSTRGDQPGAIQPEASGAIPVLTAREQGVLQLVAEGHTNREIGDRLFITEKTVSVHVSNAMAKLGALSRYEAAATAERLGLLP